MAFSFHEINRRVLSSLSERTLVNGTLVATSPIAKELEITPEELRSALDALAERRWIDMNADSEARVTPEGHLHVG